MSALRHHVLIADTAETYLCGEDETLLKAMERLNRKGIPIGCRGGGCGVCKVRITAGECARRRMSRAHVSVEDEAGGIGLACCLLPKSDVTLQVLGQMRAPVIAAQPRWKTS